MPASKLTIIGERINSSRASVRRAIETGDEAAIRREAIAQAEAGADYLDVNAGTLLENESESLAWLVRVAQDAAGKPLCIDTVSTKAAAAALRVHRGKAILNSVSGEKQRLAGVLPMVSQYRCAVVASCLDGAGIPETPAARLRVAAGLVDALTAAGVPREDVFIDPLVQPLSVDQAAALKVIKTVELIRKDLPGVGTVCGVSNISFGLPSRKRLNRAFLVLALAAGVDTVMVDPLDERLMTDIIVARALLGQDEYCLSYIKAHRAGRLVG